LIDYRRSAVATDPRHQHQHHHHQYHQQQQQQQLTMTTSMTSLAAAAAAHQTTATWLRCPTTEASCVNIAARQAPDLEFSTPTDYNTRAVTQ